ncbi:MAG: TetR/AcrR family transcriptional regulator [Clostridia bacterium]
MEIKITKRDLILQNAIEIFCDNGFERTTISGVAKQAGIGKGTVYEYFKSKEELFASCVQTMLDYYNKGFMDILNQDISFREKLSEYFKHADQLFSRASVGISLMQKNPSGDMLFLHDIFEEERLFLKEKLDFVVKMAIDNGEIRNDVSIDTLTFYIQMSIFRIMQAKTAGEASENMTEDILTLIYSGIGTN